MQQVSDAFAITKIINSNKLIFHIKIVNFDDQQFQDFTVRYKNILQHSPSKVYFIFNTLELTSITALQSLKLSLLGIIPNIVASTFILGLIGLLGIPLDIMTITIAAVTIGIAVDNTIHYLYKIKVNNKDNIDFNNSI